MTLRHDFRNRPPEQVRVAVFGATGYIGRFVVKELVLANLHPGNQGKCYEFYDVPVLSDTQIDGLYTWRASIEQE